MIKVVLDAAGGDNAPDAVLDGVFESLESGFLTAEQVLLTGCEDQLKEAIEARGHPADFLSIIDAPDLLDSSDSPVDAMRRKPRNSIQVAVEALKRGEADTFVSAGATGVVVATAQVVLRRLEGVRRPGIAVTVKGEKGPFILIDVGANPQAKPEHLVHYACMGSAYFCEAFGKENPRVGLMNIGSEDAKGTPLIKKAGDLMREAPINFVGNVEGVDCFHGRCEVIVCDGFTGNVMLKSSEGIAEYMMQSLGKLLAESSLPAEQAQELMHALSRTVDYSKYGGALLLGVEGIVTICHGRSSGHAIANAINFAMKAAGAKVNDHIVKLIKGQE